MRNVFAGRRSDRPPVSIRLDLWRRDAKATGALPDEVRGMTPEAIEDRLGFARAARFRGGPVLRLAEGEIVTQENGAEIRTEYRLPTRTLTMVLLQTEANRRAGIQPHIVHYPLSSKEDCTALTEALQGARLLMDPAGFDALDEATGDAGLPMYIMGPCPAHHVMLRLSGYGNFYYHQADFPAEMDALIQALDVLWRRDLWPPVAASRAELVLHGAHFSSQMTPPPLFERYFLPYFVEFNRVMHAAGKKVLWHSDADVGGLLQHVLDAGFDGADCLATAPLVEETLQNYLDSWQGRIVCWGALPSVILDATYPMDAFKEYVNATARVAAGRSDVIIGASDNVMPGAPWEKLRYVKEVFCR